MAEFPPTGWRYPDRMVPGAFDQPAERAKDVLLRAERLLERASQLVSEIEIMFNKIKDVVGE